MSQLKALRQRAADINAKIKSLSETVTAAGRKMTDDEKAQLADLKAQAAENKELLEIAEQMNEAERNATSPAQNADSATEQRATTVIMGADRSAEDPKRGFKDHRDYLTAVMVAGRTNGRVIDKRLKPLIAPSNMQATQGSDEQGEYSDPHGGFLVPHAVAPGILSIAPEDDPLSGLTTNVPMQAPTVSFNARVDKNHSTSVSGGFTVSRRAETVDGGTSRMQFEQVTLVANEEFGGAFATERIINDSPQSFVAIIRAGMSTEFVANLMNERINGTGTGERQGILSTPCKISVAKETGQTAATIVKENIDKMEARCWRYNRAVWIANMNTRPQLKSLVQVVGTGGNAVPYFQGSGGQETLSGRPIFFSEFAKTVGTEGDLMLIVPSEYLEGTYESEQYAESIHVRFMAAERAFRFYRRNDGQWWWRSALTPKNGSTLSPVVTLATRS
jgi:HK97 family phage major capsid protein